MSHNINNQVTLIGHLGADCTQFEAGGGGVEFRMATNQFYKKDGERKKRTEWHRCVLYGKRAASLAGRLKRSVLLGVTGAIRNDKYETEKDGVKHIHHGYAIIVSDITILQEKQDKQDKQDKQNKQSNADDSSAPVSHDDYVAEQGILA